MNTNQCPHCGSSKNPVSKAVWSTKDKVITVILFLVFFPAGIVCFFIKQLGRKEFVCPDCKIPYNLSVQTDEVYDSAKIVGTIKTVAKNPEVRRAVKNVKSSLKDFQDTLGPY